MLISINFQNCTENSARRWWDEGVQWGGVFRGGLSRSGGDSRLVGAVESGMSAAF